MTRVKCRLCDNILKTTLKQIVRWNHKGLCGSCARRGKNNPRWKGGVKEEYGYKYIKIDSDDFFFSMAHHDGYIAEHRLVIARRLGRCLESWEVVHHINGQRGDNRLTNLELVIRRCHRTSYADAYNEGYQDALKKLVVT